MSNFEADGYMSPISVLTDEEVAEARQGLERSFEERGRPLPRAFNHKAHLVFGWADALVHHPLVLDVVEKLIGPNILCWTSNLFYKPAHSDAFVSWHQDAVYPRLEPPHVVSCWIALTPSNSSNGCLRVVPGSHTWELAQYVDTFAADNMLSRGQVMQVDDIDRQAVDVCLQPGQMSIHQFAIAHASGPNQSNEPRIGFVARYMPTTVKQTAHPESATLVRGRDKFSHFQPEVPFHAHSDPRRGELEHASALRHYIRNGYAKRGNETLPAAVRLWARRNIALLWLTARRTRLMIRSS